MRAGSHQGVLITTINGQPVAAHPMARFLMDAGFHPGPLGLHLRRIPIPIHHDQQHADPAAKNCSRRCPKAIPFFAPRARWGAHWSGKPITAFRSNYPLLTRFHDDTPITGQTVDSVESRGKWLLIHFSGGATLATHMLMNGSWHLYPRGERWRRPARDMRIVLENRDYQAVAFTVPVARMYTAQALAARKAHPASRFRRTQRRLRSCISQHSDSCLCR